MFGQATASRKCHPAAPSEASPPDPQPGLPATASLDRYDAILLLLPTDAKPAVGLPIPAAGRHCIAMREGAHAEVRTVTLDNHRQTLGVLGYCRKDADEFELLRVAGLLAQRHSRTGRSRCVWRWSCRRRSDRAAWQEAVYAALAAHCLPCPATKPDRQNARRFSIDAFGESSLDARARERHGRSQQSGAAPDVAAAERAGCGGVPRACWRHWRGATALRCAGTAKLLSTRLGAGAFLAVSRGNPRRDAGIAHLSYTPRNAASRRADLALVGKGVLFDTGGTNLKPHKSMLDMHTDMAGSAVALATIVAAAQLRAPLAIDAWLAITENNIGPEAYRPQEVVRAMNGTTIQVIHSDAEGRMALADTLALAARRRPRAMLDFATLTGPASTRSPSA